jgi:GNAT superfamily N-acetyltransferase
MSRIITAGSDALKGIGANDDLAAIRLPVKGGLIHKVLRNVNDYGWHVAMDKSLAYLIRGLYFRQVYRIYRINLDAVVPSFRPSELSFTFKILTPKNLDMIAQVESTAEWLHGQVKERIECGQLCLVALDGERVAGFNLINLEEASLILVNLRLKLRQGSAWSEHIAVDKSYRKSGLGRQLRFRVFEALRARGVHRLYGGTLRSNIASLALTRSVGFTEISDVHYRKFLSFEDWQFKRVRRSAVSHS